ncbi:MAG: hypothetical protein GY800_04725 [Planctomycetes bacterium]|nr:hypothetical protein [Planctomycetota bacterium]
MFKFVCSFAIAVLMLTAAGRAAATGYELVRAFPVEVEEPSGLAYDPKTNTLWTVRDGGGNLFQLNTRGELLRKIDFTSNDLEGIAYKPSTNTFLLAEERTREILEIDRQGKILWVVKVPTGYSWWNVLHRNHGIEGVTYDPKSGSIFVVNEKGPKAVIELIEGDAITKSFEIIEADDLSGIHFDDKTGNLLVLSHESRKVMEFTTDGRLVSSFTIDAPKAEGITKDTDGNIYIISEKSNMLYVYNPVE